MATTIKRFSPRQREVLTWWSDASPHRDRDAIICDGAVRSGKTLAMGLSFVLWATRRFSGEQFALCGRTIGALRRNVLAPLLPLLRELGFSCREQGAQGKLTLSLGGRRNTFYLFGGKDSSSAALIQGVTLAGALFDEAALMPRSFVEQACLPAGLRLKNITCAPIEFDRMLGFYHCRAEALCLAYLYAEAAESGLLLDFELKGVMTT